MLKGTDRTLECGSMRFSPKRLVLLAPTALLLACYAGVAQQALAQGGDQDRGPAIVVPELETSEEISNFFKQKRVRTRSVAKPVKSRGIRIVEDGASVEQTINYDRVAAFQIQFRTNSARLSPESLAVMREISRALQDPALTSAKFYINGHTDSVGNDAHNLDLSKRRAQAVLATLIELGLRDRSRFEARGFGERVALAPNDTKDGRAKNRRVELEMR